MSDTQEPEENRYYLLLVAAFTLTIITLWIISIVLIAPEIEQDLNQKITEELEKKGVNATVSLSGRDVTLSGTINDSTDIQKVQESLTDMCGIHFIDNQLVSSDTTAPPTTVLANNDPLHPSPTPPKPAVTPSTNNEKISDNTPNVTLPPVTGKQYVNTEKEGKKEKESTTTTATQNSSQAYEKILAAMSHHNEKKSASPKTSTGSQSSFDFDTSTIQFKQNNSKLSKATKKALSALANQLNKTEKTIKITVSSKTSNLAFNRAKKIKQYLINQGIKSERIIIIGTTKSTKKLITIVEHND